MQAMIFTVLPHTRQVLMSMPNTHFRRCAQVLRALSHESECPASVRTRHESQNYGRLGWVELRHWLQQDKNPHHNSESVYIMSA
jgi:hypothetical protein